MSNEILNLLNDQKICACLLNENFNIIEANRTLKDIIFNSTRLKGRTLYSLEGFDLFSLNEKRSLRKLLDDSEAKKVKSGIVPQSLEHYFVGNYLYQSKDGFICSFIERRPTKSPKHEYEDGYKNEVNRLSGVLTSFKRLVNLNRVAFLQLSRFGTILDVVSNDIKIFKNEPSVGKAFLRVFEDALAEKIWLGLTKAKDSDELYSFEYHVMNDNVKNWFVFEINPIPNGSIIMIRDITKDKQKMRLEVENDRLTTLGILAGGLAHQFNNIHHVILGNLDLINYVETQEQLDDCVDTVKRSILKASSLTEKLLSFSRSKKEVVEPYSLERVIKTAYDFTEEKFLKSSVSFSLRKVEKDLYIGLMDAALFEQVLINLFINAIQAKDLSKDKAKLFVDISLSKDEESIFCDIIDNGIGIEIENVDKIFTPLFTTKGEFSKSEGDKEKGTGLGLSLSKKLISDMGGNIQLLETSKKGTTFRITLKKADYDNLNGSLKVRESLHMKKNKPLKVVVFDDEYETRRFLSNYFNTLDNIKIKEFSNGDIDFKKLARFKPDIILLDWIMPKKNGHDVLNALHQTSSELLKKTIVISGHIPHSEFDDWEGKVANKLSKPLMIEDLNRAIF